MVGGDGYSEDINCPTGRVNQLKMVAEVKFPNGGDAEEFMCKPVAELDGKTPDEMARLSIDGLKRATDYIKPIKAEKLIL